MAANYGGHDYAFVEKNLERFICNSICTKVLRDPHLTGCCGQHFCESCLKNWLTKNHTKSCPHCRAEGEEFTYILDKKLKREIDSLRIYCTKKKKGCQWVGEVGSLKTHLESENGCGYVIVECPNKCECDEDLVKKMKRKDLKYHLKNECYLRPYQCEHCGYKGTYRAITGNTDSTGNSYRDTVYKCTYPFHYALCPEFPMKFCPNWCGAVDIKRKNIEYHLSRCPEAWVMCSNKCARNSLSPFIFLEENRDYEYVQRKNLAKHLKEECKLRQHQCEHCGMKDNYIAIRKHYFLCREFPLECHNKCGTKDIKRKDMKDHRKQCPEELVECSNKCIARDIRRKDLAKHLSDKCPLRPYECEHCKLNDTKKVIIVHYRKCPEFPLDCPSKCGAKDIKRKDLRDHCSKCAKEYVECPFEEAGCKEKLARHELKQHMSTTQQQHLLMVMGAYKEMKKDNEELKKDTAETKKANEELKKDNVEIKKANEELKKDNVEIKKANEELKKDNMEIKQAYRETQKTLTELKRNTEENKQAIRNLQFRMMFKT